MRDVLTPGQMLAVQARLQPDRIGARDLERAMTFRQWNARACRLANASSACMGARCAVTTCSAGFADCDADADTGGTERRRS